MAQKIEYIEDMTVVQYLGGVSPLISEDMINTLLIEKNISLDTPAVDMEEKDRDLLKADALILCATSPTTTGGFEEQVGNWRTKVSGNTMTNADKAAMKRMARYLYRKWNVPYPYPSSVRIVVKGMAI